MASKWARVNYIPGLTLREARLRFHNEPCCYAIYLDGRLSYVGQTQNLRTRLKGYNFHRVCRSIQTPWGRYKSVVIKYRSSVRYGDWAMVELRLIRRLQPQFNCQGILRARGITA